MRYNRDNRKKCGYKPFRACKICSRENRTNDGDFNDEKLKNETCNECNQHHEVLISEYVQSGTVNSTHAKHMEEFGKSKRGERHRLRLVKGVFVRGEQGLDFTQAIRAVD